MAIFNISSIMGSFIPHEYNLNGMILKKVMNWFKNFYKYK